MVFDMASGIILLKEFSIARTVAQLEAPSGNRSAWMTFAADGTKLITIDWSASSVHVWDLRAIRAGLKTMGLDWDWPEFPPLKESLVSARSRPLKVEVFSADAP